MSENGKTVAGVDVGTESVKVLILRDDDAVVGRSVVPTRGYFQERCREALDAALDDAKLKEPELAEIYGTGFGASMLLNATKTVGETACHARGAFHHVGAPMTVVNIGGREPRVIHVDAQGRPEQIFTLRQCAVGVGTFLMFAARHLDVHPTQLQELAAAAETPVPVGSYCSVFAGAEVLERLREGATREEVALGCMHSIAERIVEIGGFEPPLKVTGGVVEYFPGVLAAMAELTGMTVESVPEPIMVGALGAALMAQGAVEPAAS
jgi:predicted CoA-substrate-specific enzyme activase